MDATRADRHAFGLVGLGGTFDRLHPGHERLLDVALAIGDTVVVGLATDALLQGKASRQLIQPYVERERALHAFAAGRGRAGALTIVPLDDPFGPAATDPRLEAHVSSEETFGVARQINEARARAGIPPLVLVMIPMVIDAGGKRYSSSSIRERL